MWKNMKQFLQQNVAPHLSVPNCVSFWCLPILNLNLCNTFGVAISDLLCNRLKPEASPPKFCLK